MTKAWLNDEVFYGKAVYLGLSKIGGTDLYYQNFQANPYSYGGNDYNFLEFNLQLSARNSDLASTETSLILPRVETLLTAIRSLGGLRKAPVIAYTVFPYDDVVYREVFTVNSTNSTPSVIQVSLSSPLTSVFGSVPSIYYDSTRVPELPLVNNPRF
jgi:hypothetical protein